MPPIKLTDAELDSVLAAARPLSIELRDPFLHAVARELQSCRELGPGVVHRVVAQVQREFFDPPDLDRGHVPRWSSRRRNGVRAG